MVASNSYVLRTFDRYKVLNACFQLADPSPVHATSEPSQVLKIDNQADRAKFLPDSHAWQRLWLHMQAGLVEIVA